MKETRLRRLLELLQGTDVEEFEWEHSFWRGTRLRVCRRRAGSQLVPATPPPGSEGAHQGPPPPVEVAPGADLADAAAPGADDLLIASPMVGTFYRASSPEAQPFVSPGDQIRLGQTVGVIEAMKIMNEIHAEVEGVVVEVLAANGDPVEYNQPLLKLRPL